MKAKYLRGAALPAALFMHASAEGEGGAGGGSPPPPPSPPAAPPPPPAPSGDEPFYAKENYDEPTRAYLVKNGFKSNLDVIKTAMNAEQFIGMKPEQLLKLPADRTHDKMGDVFTQLGKPADVAGYGVQPNAEIGLDGPVLEGFLKVAHEQSHLTKDQLAPILKWYGDNVAAGGAAKTAQTEAEFTAAETAIKNEFGDAYDDKVKGIIDHIREHGGDELADHIESSKLGNNLAFAKYIDKMVQLTAERGGLPGERGRDTTPNRLTPDQAQAKLRDFESANHAALMNKSHGDHAQVVKEREALIKAAHP